MERFTNILLVLIVFLMVHPFDVKGARPIQIKAETDDDPSIPNSTGPNVPIPGFPEISITIPGVAGINIPVPTITIPGFTNLPFPYNGTNFPIPGFTGSFPIPGFNFVTPTSPGGSVGSGPSSTVTQPITEVPAPGGSPGSDPIGTLVPPTSPSGSSGVVGLEPTSPDGSLGPGPGPLSPITLPTGPGGSSNAPSIDDGSSGPAVSSTVLPPVDPPSTIFGGSSGSGPLSNIIPLPTSPSGPWGVVGLEPSPDESIGPGPSILEVPAH